MYKKVINDIPHYIFKDENEFRELFPKEMLHDDWRNAPEGSWVRSDDGQILEILKKGEMRRGLSKQYHTYVRTLLGMRVVNSDYELSGEPPIHIYSFSSDKHPKKRRLEREKYNGREFIFAQYIATGLDPIDAYLRAFPTNKRKHAEFSAKLLLKTKRVQKLITQKIEEKMDSLGISEEWLLDEVKGVIKGKKSKDNNKLRALELLMKVRGMFPSSEQKSESLTVFQGFTPEQLDSIRGSNSKKLKTVNAEIKQ